MSKQILRLEDVKKRTGLTRSTIYWQMKEGKFPKSIPLGKRVVGWDADDIDEWIKQKIAAAKR